MTDEQAEALRLSIAAVGKAVCDRLDVLAEHIALIRRDRLDQQIPDPSFPELTRLRKVAGAKTLHRDGCECPKCATR